MPQYLDYTDDFARPSIDPPGQRAGAEDPHVFKTATGKIFHADFFGFVPGCEYFYIRVLDSSFGTVSTVLDDPAEVAIIEHGGHKISGYAMNYCQHDGDAIKVFMQKGA